MNPTLQDLLTQLDDVNAQLSDKYAERITLHSNIQRLEKQALDLKREIKEIMASKYNME